MRKTIINGMVQLWLLNGEEAVPLMLQDMSSLDAVTRMLPVGLYTTFRTFHERTYALGLKSHLQRLYRPASRLGVRVTAIATVLRAHIAMLLSDYSAQEARVRVILATEKEPGTVYLAIEPLKTPSPEIYRRGVGVFTTQAHRHHPELKSTAFIEESQAERHRLEGSSAYEGLIVQNGRILEGLTSNFFYVLEDRLGTARRGVLNGVTRRQVIRIAEGQELSVTYKALMISQIESLQEAFLTSSSRGIVPIVTIDEMTIDNGRVGECTHRLMMAYSEEVEQQIEPISAGS